MPSKHPNISITRAYVCVQGRLVHYRTCGQGPCVVLLHDSPRSSRLHLATMEFLARRFTVVALDTPGYGLSDPLSARDPSIEDFGTFLGETLSQLGLAQAPVYATHTSAKIALALADAGGRMARLVLDGLSMPETLADETFIARYMRPFVPDASGAYLAAEWSRQRDMLRWFPWFDTNPERRIAMEAPDAAWMADYGIDLFSAGPHYSDAYAAAMSYDPAPALARVRVPTLVAARRDDVLHGYLARAGACGSPMVTTQSLAADTAQWREWLLETLADGALETALPAPEPAARFYAHHRHGALHMTRSGPPDDQPWLVLSAPTTLQAHVWGQELAQFGGVIVPDLPGFGESDPLPPGASLSDFAQILGEVIAAMGITVRVLAIGMAAPLAAALSTACPDRVRMVTIDGLPPIGEAFGQDLYPPIAFDERAGSHLHRIWHMLRDGETQWPWFDNSLAAQRRLPPILAADALHAALTGVLKQPEDWGQAAHAAIEGHLASLWDAVKVPLVAFTHADPAYADAPHLKQARMIARPDDTKAAAQILARLDAAQPEAS